MGRIRLSELWNGLRDGDEARVRVSLQDGIDNGRWLTKEMDESRRISLHPYKQLGFTPIYLQDRNP